MLLACMDRHTHAMLHVRTTTTTSCACMDRWRSTTLTSEYQDCHAVVKEAEYLRVQELVKRIENHPHREALQADLQQNNVHNPSSNNSKAMIRELGNVELFELCETIPNVLNVFFIGIKELSTAPSGSSWLKANPEESLIT